MIVEPKYYQIKQDISKKIEDGVYQTDQLLPTEKELMAHYQVSRITIRKALDELVNDSIVYKIQGKGTYVGNPTGKGINVLRLTSCVSELRKHGFSTERVVLNSRIVECTPELQKAYGLCPDERYFEFERIYTGNGIPYSYEISFYLYRYVIGIENFDLAQKSIHTVLKDLHFYDYSIRRTTEIKAILSSGELSQRLCIADGFPLLQLYLESFSCDDGLGESQSKCVEVHKAIWRSDTIPVVINA